MTTSHVKDVTVDGAISEALRQWLHNDIPPIATPSTLDQCLPQVDMLLQSLACTKNPKKITLVKNFLKVTLRWT